MLVPTLAERLNAIFGDFLTVISYLILFGIIVLIPLAIWSYFHNRYRQDDLSITINKGSLDGLTEQVTELREVKRMLDKFLTGIEDKAKGDRTD